MVVREPVMERKRRILPPVYLLMTLLAMAAFAASSFAANAPTIVEPSQPCEMWIELTEPVAADTLDPAETAERARRIAAQQEKLGEQLRELGIEEVARVRHVRNAVLVIMSPAQATLVAKLPGVLRVYPAETLHPPVPSGG